MPEPVQLDMEGGAVPVLTRGGRAPLCGCAAAAHVHDRTWDALRLFEPVDGVLVGQQALATDSVAGCAKGLGDAS